MKIWEKLKANLDGFLITKNSKFMYYSFRHIGYESRREACESETQHRMRISDDEGRMMSDREDKIYQRCRDKKHGKDLFMNKCR